MHEVLISLLAWRRELIHEVCISLRRAESPKRDQNLVNDTVSHKQNRLIGGSKESKPRIYAGTAHFFMVKMFLNWKLFEKSPVDLLNFVPGFFVIF